MLRIFEDHESIYTAMSYWMKNTKNVIRYAMKENKYHFMIEPEKYFLPPNFDMSQIGSKNALRIKLINDLLPTNTDNTLDEERHFQSFSSVLYMKEYNKKRWIKKYVSLRSDGIYFYKGDYKQALKGKTEQQNSNLKKSTKNTAPNQQIFIRAAHFADCNLYYGFGWQKNLKAPNNFGFALKSPVIQTKNKNIAYFCCDNESLFNRWIVNIRVAKYGSNLRFNYNYVTKDRPLETYIKLIKLSHDKRIHPEKYKNVDLSSLVFNNTPQDSSVNSQNSQQHNLPLHNNLQNFNSTNTDNSSLLTIQNDKNMMLQSNQNMVNRHNQNKILPPMTQFYTQQSSSSNLNNLNPMGGGLQSQHNANNLYNQGINKYPPPPAFVHELGNHFHENQRNIEENQNMQDPDPGFQVLPNSQNDYKTLTLQKQLQAQQQQLLHQQQQLQSMQSLSLANPQTSINSNTMLNQAASINHNPTTSNSNLTLTNINPSYHNSRNHLNNYPMTSNHNISNNNNSSLTHQGNGGFDSDEFEDSLMADTLNGKNLLKNIQNNQLDNYPQMLPSPVMPQQVGHWSWNREIDV